jgi:hypothetical protein
VVELADHGEVLAPREEAVDRGVLRREADPPPHPGRVGGDVDPGDARDARVGLRERGQDADGGGLAGAVRPEQAADGTARHVERDAVERRLVAVSLDEVVDLDRC